MKTTRLHSGLLNNKSGFSTAEAHVKHGAALANRAEIWYDFKIPAKGDRLWKAFWKN